jgi:hypothetical protein
MSRLDHTTQEREGKKTCTHCITQLNVHDTMMDSPPDKRALYKPRSLSPCHHLIITPTPEGTVLAKAKEKKARSQEAYSQRGRPALSPPFPPCRHDAPSSSLRIEGRYGEQPPVLPGVHAPVRRAGRGPRGAPQRARRRAGVPAHRGRRARGAPQPRAHGRVVRGRRVPQGRRPGARLRAQARPHLLPRARRRVLHARRRRRRREDEEAQEPRQQPEEARPPEGRWRLCGAVADERGGAGQLPARAPVGEAGGEPDEPPAAAERRSPRRVAPAAGEHS